MTDDYLWDGSGEVDPDVAQLERLLRPLRLGDPAARPPLPIAAPARRGLLRPLLAAAALGLLAIGGATLTHRDRPAAGEPWRVARVEGRPTLAAAPLTSRMQVTPGRWLDTDGSSSAVVFVGRIGRLEVAPHSRLRLTTAAPGEHRAELVRGTIEAQIWAPPGQFVVDTPASTAVDLGCAYTLTVDDRGVGRITVQGGWVGFEHEGRESFIPAGASGRTYPGRGPGTPTYDDAAPALREAVAVLDLADDVGSQHGPLAIVLREARREDAITLWHLLDRVEPSLRPALIARLDGLVAMPPGVTRDGLVAGDRAMRDAWWEALGLRSASWWRMWRQEWNR